MHKHGTTRIQCAKGQLLPKKHAMSLDLTDHRRGAEPITSNFVDIMFISKNANSACDLVSNFGARGLHRH